ncbi:TPA: phage replisome organizer N-terminal domain-containing protein [Streptococcus pneumoniae]
MSEIKWIKITTDIFDDEKICLIDALPDPDAILVIWFKILTLAGKHNSNGLLMMTDKVHYTDEMLATIFRRPLNTVRMAIGVFEQFGMIEIIDGIISLPNWEKHQNVDGMEKIKEQTRNRVAKYRKKQKNLALGNVTGNVTVTDGNALEEDKDKNKNRLDKDKELDKDIEINNNKVMISSSLSENLKNSGIHLTNKSHQQLLEYVGLDGMSFDMLNRAVEKTSGSHKPSFNYLIAILESWKKKGFTSIEQVDEDDRKYKEGKNYNHSRQQNNEISEQEVKDEWGF